MTNFDFLIGQFQSRDIIQIIKEGNVELKNVEPS